MKGSWKDLLYFNSRERNGISVLIVLILMLFGIQQLMPLFVGDTSETELEQLNAYVATLDAKTDSTTLNYRVKPKNERRRIHFEEAYLEEQIHKNQPISFNPNTATDSIWMLNGLNIGQVRSIRNYQSKGGEFRVKRDVAKLYVVDKQWYDKMEPYILLPDSVESKKSKALSEKRVYDKRDTTPEYASDTLVVELNSADTARLKALRGIGDYYASKIVKYRSLLGGYVVTAQLSEIYNMRGETLSMLEGHVVVDTSLVKKLNVNKLSAGQLSRHPYITWNMAKSIVAYREEHGRFKKVVKLLDAGLLNDELYRKIAPYLEVTTSEQ